MKTKTIKTIIPSIFFLVAFFVSSESVQANSAIIWSGDFETGDFMQWHNLSISNPQPNYSQMPTYGRPVPYGDGSLLSIVTSPVRQGTYAAKFTVKNSINGTEPADCDVPFPTCTQRRTELTGQATQPLIYNAIPYMSERWMSISHYIPLNWSDSGSGWGPVVFQLKPLNEDGLSHCIGIGLENGTWVFYHTYWASKDPLTSSLPWQYRMHYDKVYPQAGVSPLWNDGVADFVDPELSRQALGSINKGGWTDWIMHVKFDARGSAAGGTGFLKLWKREGSNAWIPILDIRPRVISRGGITFDRGICFNRPPETGTYSGFPNNGGFGIKAGMYMAKEQVWNLPQNRVIYNDNIKIGSEKATFAMMTPEYSGSSSSLLGDLNNDGKVDIFDYTIFISEFGKTGSNLASDLNKDGKVDIFDYTIFSQNFGKTN
jgi:hypothetical protein